VSFTDHDPGIRVLLCSSFRIHDWNFENLSAPYWRFYRNAQPGASVFLAGRQTRLVPSRCVAIPPNTPFAARLRRPVEHFYIHFLAAPPYDAVTPGIYTFPAEPLLVSTMDEIGKLLAAGGAGPRVALLCRLLAAHALSRLPADAVPPARSDGRVLAALRLMEASFPQPVSNPRLARAAGMNVNAFIRLFKQVTGRPPQSDYAARRIDRACVMLAATSASIEEIAAATGFCDRYHFSRVFKKLRGAGPAEYRRRSHLERAGSQ
jgi:AraC-like DNA-binding protein